MTSDTTIVPFLDDRRHPYQYVAVRYDITASGTIGKHRAEPIAADLRKGGDGVHRAKMKLIAGVLGRGHGRGGCPRAGRLGRTPEPTTQRRPRPGGDRAAAELGGAGQGRVDVGHPDVPGDVPARPILARADADGGSVRVG